MPACFSHPTNLPPRSIGNRKYDADGSPLSLVLTASHEHNRIEKRVADSVVVAFLEQELDRGRLARNGPSTSGVAVESQGAC